MTSDGVNYLITQAVTGREIAACLTRLAEQLDAAAARGVLALAEQFARLGGGDPAERHAQDYATAAACLEELAREAAAPAAGLPRRAAAEFAAAASGDDVARAGIGGPGLAALELARAVIQEHRDRPPAGATGRTEPERECGCRSCQLAAAILGGGDFGPSGPGVTPAPSRTRP